MDNKIDFKKYIETEFAEERKMAFQKQSDVEIPVEYDCSLQESFIKAIEELKTIIRKNASLYCEIMSVKPLQYNSVGELVNAVSAGGDEPNFRKAISEIPVLKEELVYIDAQTNEKRNLNYDDTSKTMSKTVSIRNNLINVVGNTRKKYGFKTYSALYTYFMLRYNDSVCSNELTFRKYNQLLDFVTEILEGIGKTEKRQEKLLFVYLTERGCAMAYKFYLYQYAQKFSDEIRHMTENEKIQNNLMRDYLVYSAKFRDVHVFCDSRFFEKVHTIVSTLLKARYQYMLHMGEKLDTDIYKRMCQDKLDAIIQDLYVYQLDCIESVKERRVLSLEEYAWTMGTKFAQYSRDQSDVSMWNQVQSYVNMHIETDYDRMFFGIQPKNNAQTYEARVVFNQNLEMMKNSQK